MKKLLYLLTGLCLLAGLFVGCEKPNETGEGGGGTTPTEKTGLQIQDVNGNTIAELNIDESNKGVFVLKNVSEKIVEWEIPTLAVDWISSFSKQSGKLAPDASDLVELTIDRSRLSDGINEALLYIGSSVGDKMLKINVRIEMSYQLLNTQDEEISELDLDNEQGSFKIKNTGNGVLNWSISGTTPGYVAWLRFDGYEGSLEPDDEAIIVLQVDPRNVAVGTNEEILHISSTGGDKQLTVRFVFSGYMEEDLGGGISLKMLIVQGDIFEMGATEEQGSDADDNEKPIQIVSLDNFYMGETEVTQAQWKAVMGTNPSNWKGDNLPVEQVSWNDAQEFCRKLSQMTGKTYRLPTEAEWEYAARGGNKSQHYKYAGSNDIDEVAWYSYNSDSKTHPVGTKKANELGIYDMSGNVWEWCSDWYGAYSNSAMHNPQGPESGSFRVNRGGGWNYRAVYCRVSRRFSFIPGYRSDAFGFRVACSSK